jgi:hypothetical protein
VRWYKVTGDLYLAPPFIGLEYLDHAVKKASNEVMWQCATEFVDGDLVRRTDGKVLLHKDQYTKPARKAQLVRAMTGNTSRRKRKRCTKDSGTPFLAYDKQPEINGIQRLKTATDHNLLE